MGLGRGIAGGVEALKGLDLKVPRGCIYGLLGPNGAGKSTLVKILTTLIRRTAGEGTMLGRPIGDRWALRKVGLLPEHAKFPDYLTGRQVIEFSGGLQDVPGRERAKKTSELLELVGMTGAQGRKMKKYSKGMKQRIGIAQALVNDPEIVFLDEPTDGVDPAGRRDFRVLVKRLREEGRTIFINTHILSELEPIVDRVAILSGGELRGEGVLAELRERGPEYRIGFEGALPAALSAGLEAKGHKTGEGLLEVNVARAEEIQPVIDDLRREEIVISSIARVEESLEELFLGYVDRPVAEAAPPPLPGGGAEEIPKNDKS